MSDEAFCTKLAELYRAIGNSKEVSEIEKELENRGFSFFDADRMPRGKELFAIFGKQDYKITLFKIVQVIVFGDSFGNSNLHYIMILGNGWRK